MKMQDCTAALLCGGKSSRMGFDKVRLQEKNGGFLLAQNAQTLAGSFATVALVAAQGQSLEGIPGLEGFGLWRDNYPKAGPLGAVCTALEQAETPWIFALACDMPHPDMALALGLYRALGSAQAGLFVRDGRPEPLFAFYHKSCVPVFQSQLAAGQMRLRDGFSRLRVKKLEITQRDAVADSVFINLNTPVDVAEWQKKRSGNEEQKRR